MLGDTVDRDPAKAVELYRRAAAIGVPQVCPPSRGIVSMLSASMLVTGRSAAAIGVPQVCRLSGQADKAGACLSD